MRLVEAAAQARHRDRIAHEVFRRSLRRLALDDPQVRRARKMAARRRAGKKMSSRI
jgi:hypothetical protein